MYYERFMDEEDGIDIHRNANHVYPAHFHKRIEILIINRGSYFILHNNKQLEITNGMLLVLESFDVHRYISRDSDKDFDDCVILLPHQLLTKYNEIKNNRNLSCNVIKNPSLCKDLLQYIDQNLDISKKNVLLKQSFVDKIMGSIVEVVDFSKKTTNSNEVGLTKLVLDYIENNFKKPLSLSIIASHFGYSNEHISRIFHKYMQQSMVNYINAIRLMYIKQQKKLDRNKKIVDLIFDAGFNSIQTYYRSLKNIETY